MCAMQVRIVRVAGYDDEAKDHECNDEDGEDGDAELQGECKKLKTAQLELAKVPSMQSYVKPSSGSVYIKFCELLLNIQPSALEKEQWKCILQLLELHLSDVLSFHITCFTIWLK